MDELIFLAISWLRPARHSHPHFCQLLTVWQLGTVVIKFAVIFQNGHKVETNAHPDDEGKKYEDLLHLVRLKYRWQALGMLKARDASPWFGFLFMANFHG